MRERLHLREGWSSLVLLLLVLLTVTLAFEAGGLAEGLHILPAVALLGALVGLILAKVRLPGFVAHALGLWLGVVFCFLLLGTLIELPVGAQLDGWLAEHLAKGELLATRLQVWLGAALHGESSTDPLPFVVQMAGITWLISFYGAWAIFHSHWVWGAVLPPGIAIFLGIYYAPPGLLVYFVLYLLWAFILIVRANVYQRERDWQSHHAVYDRYIGLEFLRDGALVALLVVGLVWVLPHPSLALRLPAAAARALEGPWRVVHDEWNRLYASLTYRGQVTTGTFSRTLALGGGVNLGTAPVLEVRAPEHHYWRAVVLDRYTGTGWVDTSPARLRLDAGAPLADEGAHQARVVITQTVTCLRADEPLLFAAAEPLQVPLRTDVQAFVTPSGAKEISCISSAQSLGSERRYSIASLVSVASERRLRQAGTAYPTWVAERYLQLPESLPERVEQLAREVAGSEATPYDRAAAIEAYLRQIRYNESIDAPPEDTDPVDWFLFEKREGYCTYHASAMVLMCRAVGVPARLAQGYAPGEYVESRGAYLVREGDAHAWPEIYFPGYGWIEFEPTPAQPPVVRPVDGPASYDGQPSGPAMDPVPPLPGDEYDLEDLLPDVEPGEGAADRRPLVERLPWGSIVLGMLAGVAAAGMAWHYGRRWWALGPAERLYARLGWLARPLGVSADPCWTPREFGLALDQALAADRPLAGELVELYLRERFAGRRPAPEEIAAGRRTWRRLLLIAGRRALGRAFRGRRAGGAL